MNPPDDNPAALPPAPSSQSAYPFGDSWHHRISFKLIVGLLLLFAFFSLSAYLAMRIRGREVIAEQSDRLTHEVGRKLVLQLTEHIEASEALARNLAKLGETLPHDISLYHQVVPKVLDLENKRTLIAGGGIWPEPNAFAAGVERRSFFWGRNREGMLEYYDDYNAPDGPGYHHEEWYEPARHTQPGRVYWSKSYMDPYSFEPMVTCTVPMRANGQFTGVVTVDLKLNGIAIIMDNLAKQTGGYAFVVDRNNNFICFPNQTLASRVVTGTDGKQIQEQRDAAGAAQERPDFLPVAQLLASIDADARTRAGAGNASAEDLAQLLRNRINQLGVEEAHRIAIGLLSPDAASLQAHPLDLTKDVILHERTQMLVYEMPSTHWKVALAMPVRQTQAVVDTVIERVAWFLLAVSLGVCAMAWFFFHRAFLRPLASLTLRLRELAGQKDQHARLPIQGRDELARLAYWFNVRTDMLEQAYVELKEQSRLINEARLAAERADRSKNIFLASMSHELRTPLNAIIGMSSFLQGTSLSEEQADYARTIHSSSNALLDLVNDIMDFSKIEAGQLELEKTDFDLRIILDEISDMLAYVTSEKGLHFSCLLDPSAESWLRGDPGRIRQIIANLAANAVKFTRTGEIEILGRTTGEDPNGDLRLEFTVRDTGVGIPDSARDRMFKPYSQAVSSTTRQYGGTGLGLAICKQLCLRMGGDIDFTSSPQGTTFRFHIRIGRGQDKHRPNPTPLQSIPGEWHCLVLDADENYGRLLARQLTLWGLPATHVANLESLPAAANATTVNSVLVISGVDERIHPGAGTRVRDILQGRTCKIVSHLQSNGGNAAIDASGAANHAFLPRPLRTGQLVRTITHLLGGRPQESDQAPATRHAALLTATARILVVEDNSLNQKVILKMLQNLGYRTMLAENGALAVDLATNQSFDLILMDWHMPVMDGLEATRRIREGGTALAAVPIIALTASALQNEREQCFLAGMNDYLSKPITEKNLKLTLQKWLPAGPFTPRRE